MNVDDWTLATQVEAEMNQPTLASPAKFTSAFHAKPIHAYCPIRASVHSTTKGEKYRLIHNVVPKKSQKEDFNLILPKNKFPQSNNLHEI